MQSPNSKVITLSKVNKRYGHTQALVNVSTEIVSGKCTALLGPNGAGKSTMMKLLSTLCPPTSGTLTHTPSTKIGYVGQKLAIDPFLTVKQNIVFSCEFHQIPSSDRQSRIDSCLNLVKLDDLQNKIAGKLSGGQQRRLDIACSLVNQPTLLLLDEPSVGLDPSARRLIWQALKKEMKCRHFTLIFSTHYLEEADEFADEILMFDKGKLVADGTPESLKLELGEERLLCRYDSIDATHHAAKELEKAFPSLCITLIETKLFISLYQSDISLGQLFGFFAQGSISPEEISFSKPSLEDVYLKLTGKDFATNEIDPNATLSQGVFS